MNAIVKGEGGAVRLGEMLKCAERELAMRRRVYPRLVANLKLGEGEADREIRLMQNIVDYLKADLSGA